MISLKRNSKKEFVEAKGLRKKISSIYSPNQTEDFKVSRGKFSNFLLCPRCFYLDRVKGLAEPAMPGWTLNERTDFLLKKEFDECRKKKFLIDFSLNITLIISSHLIIPLWMIGEIRYIKV